MSTRHTAIRWILTTALTALVLSQASAWAAEPAEPPQRAIIGVRLDPQPLPRLLTKHLHLDQDQGLVILNVIKDSPATRAGLDRDDIILALEGNTVTDYRTFVTQVQQAGVGTEVALEIMHEGQRKTVSLQLAPAAAHVGWLYPPSEEDTTGPFPGRIWRLDPGARGWQEIPFGQVPQDLHRFFEEKRTYRITEGDQDYEITIKGDPAAKDAPITVRDLKTGQQYSVTADTIDDLPANVRPHVRDTLKTAQAEPAPDDRFHFRRSLPFDGPNNDYRLPFDPEIWDHMQRQLDDSMRQWQQRMDELERRNLEQERRLDKLHEQTDQPDMEEL